MHILLPSSGFTSLTYQSQSHCTMLLLTFQIQSAHKLTDKESGM